MDVKQLRYFTEIADLGNMTRAAETLRIAQPALSQQIANLEAELGKRLFDRGPAGVALTQPGEVLYARARTLLRQVEDARRAVQEEHIQPSGGVKIGLPGSTGKLLAVPLLTELLAYPHLTLEIVERPSAELQAMVARGQLDLAIVVDASEMRGASVLPLIVEELYVIAPYLGTQFQQVTLDELSVQPLILPSQPSTIRKRIEASFLNARLNFRLVSEVSATDMLLRVVAAGLGWTLLPWSAASDDANRKQVSVLTLADERLRRELGLCTPDSSVSSAAIDTVRNMVVKTLNELVITKTWKGAEWVAA